MDPSSQGLHLLVKTRESVLLDMPIKSLSSRNAKGKFDVLDKHANLISIVEEKLIIFGRDGSKKEIPIDRGILKVRDNKISVYLGIKG